MTLIKHSWWRETDFIQRFGRKVHYTDRELLTELGVNLKKRWRSLDFDWKGISYDERQRNKRALLCVIEAIRAMGIGEDPIRAIREELDRGF